MKKKVLIILDSFEYKKKETILKQLLVTFCNPNFFYTKYENRLIELFCKTKYIGSFLQHLSYWGLSFGYAVRIAVKRNLSDYIFINPIVGIFFSLLNRILFLHKRITICGFLFEIKTNKIYFNLRKFFVNLCYHDVNKIIVYGEKEVSYYSTLFPALANKFVFIRYGKDYSYQRAKEFLCENEYIASGGRSNRYFEILCSAYDSLNSVSFDCLVATRPECVTTEMQKSKVRFVYGVTLNQFGSFLKKAKLFVLPLLNTNISAGHMSMMEAMAVGTPVIVSDIPAIRNYVNDHHVFFFKPDRADDLKDKITFVLENLHSDYVVKKINNAKKLYNDQYSFDALLKRVVNEALL